MMREFDHITLEVCLLVIERELEYVRKVLDSAQNAPKKMVSESAQWQSFLRHARSNIAKAIIYDPNITP